MIRATKSSVLALAFAAASSLGAFLVPSDAQACGGVFVSEPVIESPTSRSIVRDHRMAIAIGRTKTIIWDEVRLEGDPRDFAWITPVRDGTKIELADDEWLSALDVSTQPVVYAPRYDSRGGCALAGCASDQSTESSAPNGSVFILKEDVLGPYQSVIVRSAGDPDAPYRWLVENGYRIDDEKVRSVLASYATAGFDFAALKLRGTCNQTSMQPVRIVIPGTDPHILVRMALAGASTLVPITLFVLAEAPYRPSNFPFGFVDDDALEWDRGRTSSSSSSSSPYYSPRSNYDSLANDAMAKDGKTWLVESAQIAELAGGGSELPTPGLFEAYDALCKGSTPRGAGTRSGSNPSSSSSSSSGGGRAPCIADAGIGDASKSDASTDAGDAGDDDDAGDGGDGGGSDASVSDAGSDASSDGGSTFDAGDGGQEEEEDSGVTTGFDAGANACTTDDYTLATRDVVGAREIWVTRLRARIQPNALTNDLELVPAIASDSKAVSNLHQVARYEDEDEHPSKRSCTTTKVVKKRHMAEGSWALGAVAAIALTAWLRKKKRR